MPVSSRSLFRVALLLVVALVLPSRAESQDLVSLAKKEKERRAKVAKPVKVLTEDDGKEAAAKGAGSVTALPAESTNAAAPTEATSGGADGADPDGQKGAWKRRADGARAAVTNAEKTLAQMERDVAAYRSDMAPVSAADAQDPMRLQKRDARIFEMNKQIEAQKIAVTAAKTALVAVEDEARRAGVPAGWLR